MAGIDTGGGHGGKKSVNQELPLIPFIDFLLCCVMFLLVTAVWNQLARIEANQSIAGTPTAAPEEEPPVRRRLKVTPAGYEIIIGTDAPQMIPKNGETYNVAELHTRLAALQSSDPNRHDLIIESADGVEYHNVIDAMDQTSGAGLRDFSLSPIPMGN
jgi:biopolymer transport protein ExbD